MSDALSTLWAILGGDRGFHVLELGAWEGGRTDLWSEVTNRRRFERLCSHHGWASELRVSARPYMDRGSRRLMAHAGAVWVEVVTGKQFGALEAFDPEPSLVLRAGGTVQHWAFWGLARPVAPDAGERVNRHLAHRLRCAKKNAGQMFFPPPGSVVREGRARPLPVSVVGGTFEPVTMRVLCRTLPREIPDAEAWRRADRPAAL